MRQICHLAAGFLQVILFIIRHFGGLVLLAVLRDRPSLRIVSCLGGSY